MIVSLNGTKDLIVRYTAVFCPEDFDVWHELSSFSTMSNSHTVAYQMNAQHCNSNCPVLPKSTRAQREPFRLGA